MCIKMRSVIFGDIFPDMIVSDELPQSVKLEYERVKSINRFGNIYKGGV